VSDPTAEDIACEILDLFVERRVLRAQACEFVVVVGHGHRGQSGSS